MRIIKPKRRSRFQMNYAPNSKSVQLLKNTAQSSANSDAQRSNDDASRFGNERSSIMAPFERVRKTGLATSHVKVSIAAYMVNTNKIGSSQLTRTLPNARTLHFSINLANIHIYKNVYVKANCNVDEIIRQTEATGCCKQSLPWHSIKGFHISMKSVDVSSPCSSRL
jgi:hypothetical protein